MHNDKFVDPRLQEKEALFQHLHMVSFDVIMHINAIQEIVQATSKDIAASNEHYIELVRSFKITLTMCSELEPEIMTLIGATKRVLSDDRSHAFATQGRMRRRRLGSSRPRSQSYRRQYPGARSLSLMKTLGLNPLHHQRNP